MTAVTLDDTPLRQGCTGPNCGTQRTVQLSPYVGRRCPDHVSVPAGPLDRGLMADMCELGRFDAVFAYVRGWLSRECEQRFAAAAGRLT